MIETRGVQESFKDLQDAIMFLEREVLESASAGWALQNGIGLNYQEHQWSVGLGFYREKSGVEVDLSEINKFLGIDDEI